MDLGGTWRAAEADEAIRRVFTDPALDDAGWQPIAVPGHWRSVPAFSASDGPLLYRTAFATAAHGAHRRWWLTFDGVFYQSDVWLDGAYLGDTEGYFFPHTFEVTDQVEARSEHVLAVEAACTKQTDRTAKRNITGVFQHWDCLDPDWNPGGIWRPVRLTDTGPVAIRRLRVLSPDATTERATLVFRAILDAANAGTVTVRAEVGDLADHVEEHTLSAGENRVEWSIVVEHPPLWWPHALGSPETIEVDVSVLAAGDASEGEGEAAAALSDRRTLRTGIRRFQMKNWIASVNGERMFLKGSNQGPTRMALADATAADFERDIVLAKEANLDLVRLHAHVSRPELYDAADRHGMLLWQDFPLQWGYGRGLRKPAARQARELVDLLGHHPSIAMWCAHNEPFAIDIEPGGDIDLGLAAGHVVAGLTLPTWNKTFLDGAVKRALEKADRSRPTIAHSGLLGRTDSHLYFGWYHGKERDLPRAASAWPRLMRFVSEFGAQAVPDDAAFMDADRWPDLDWPHLGRHHALQRAFFARNGLDPAEFARFDDWRAATQQYQATVIRFHIETLRRLKYRPAGGFAHFSLADAHPAVTWSVLDAARNPKRGYHALQAACAPVAVIADRPDAQYRTGDTIDLDIHVVSDLREPIEAACVAAVLAWRGGSVRWEWQGEVPPDSCVRIGSVKAVAAETSGPLTLSLRLSSEGHRADNEYESCIVPR